MLKEIVQLRKIRDRRDQIAEELYHLKLKISEMEKSQSAFCHLDKQRNVMQR
jgi:hypothetical protein